MGNTSSAHFERTDQDAWWSNSGRADPNPVDQEADATTTNRQRDDSDFQMELERIREKRRDIIGKKRKEMEDLREEVAKLKAENEELRRCRPNENNSPEVERLRGQNQELMEILEEKSRLLRDNESIIGQNRELKMSIAETQQELQHLNAEVVSFEKEREDYRTHVVALKDVISVSKHMLQIRETQLLELRQKIDGIEKSLADREAQVLSEDLRKEYERQLGNIRNLRTLYEERQRMERREKADLVAKVEEVTKELEEEQKKTSELLERISELELDNSSKYDVIKTLESNLGLSKAECRQYQAELSVINQLFSEILLGFNSTQVVDLDKLQKHLEDHRDLLQNIVVNEISSEVSYALPKVLLDLLNQVNSESEGGLGEPSGADDEPGVSLVHQKMNSAEEIVENLPKVWRVLIELLSHQTAPTNVLSTEEDKENPCYKTVDTPKGPSLVLSVSRTFIRLKDLILEKKSLEKETNHLKQLNGHLENRLQDQEKRLELVHSELSKTWIVVGTLQKQHQKLHTQEKILRYELAQKRKLLNELKEELEDSREKWAQAREKNSNTEQQWQLLRSEFASRKNAVLSEEYNISNESGYSDDREGLSSDEEPGYETDISEGAQKMSEGVEKTLCQDIESGAGLNCSEINAGTMELGNMRVCQKTTRVENSERHDDPAMLQSLEETEDGRLHPTEGVSEITTNTSDDTVQNFTYSASSLEQDASEEQSGSSSENSQKSQYLHHNHTDTNEITDDSNEEYMKIMSAPPKGENHEDSQETYEQCISFERDEGDDSAQKITSTSKGKTDEHFRETIPEKGDESDECAQKITSAPPKGENHKDSQETTEQCISLGRDEGDDSAQKITSTSKGKTDEHFRETLPEEGDESDGTQKITSAPPKCENHKDSQETSEQCISLGRDEGDDSAQKITSTSKGKTDEHFRETLPEEGDESDGTQKITSAPPKGENHEDSQETSEQCISLERDEKHESAQKITSTTKGETHKHYQETLPEEGDDSDECAQKITSAPPKGENHKDSQETSEQCISLERDEKHKSAQKITSTTKGETHKHYQETLPEEGDDSDECAQKITSAPPKGENHEDSQETSEQCISLERDEKHKSAQKITSTTKGETHKHYQETLPEEGDDSDKCAQKITSAPPKGENHEDSQETSEQCISLERDEKHKSAQKITSTTKGETHKHYQETLPEEGDDSDECAQKITSAPPKGENHKDSQETSKQCISFERDEGDDSAQKITSTSKGKTDEHFQETIPEKGDESDGCAQKITSAPPKGENHKDSQETSEQCISLERDAKHESAQKITSAPEGENHEDSQETSEQCRSLESDECAQKITSAPLKGENHEDSQETSEQCISFERDEGDDSAQKITSTSKGKTDEHFRETLPEEGDESDGTQKITSAPPKCENHKDSQETSKQCISFERDEGDDSAQKITSTSKGEIDKHFQETIPEKGDESDGCAQKITSAPPKGENHKDSQETSEQCISLERDAKHESAQKITSAPEGENHEDSQETSEQCRSLESDECAQKITSAPLKGENHEDSQETSEQCISLERDEKHESAQIITSAPEGENHEDSQETSQQCRSLESDECAQKITSDRHERLENLESGSDKKPAMTQAPGGPMPGPSSGRKLTLEEVLARRDERLRRLEGQASQLVSKVANTAIRSVAISNRLDDLHEVYGQGADEDGPSMGNGDGSRSTQGVQDDGDSVRRENS